MKLILAQFRGLPFFSHVLHLLGHIFSSQISVFGCKNWTDVTIGDRSCVGSGPATGHRCRARCGKADPSLSAEDDSGGGIAVAPSAGNVSLEGVHGSVKLPGHEAGFWRQWWAFSGPAILVSVGYMDPGNWGTDLQAGAQYKFGLLWVVGMASLMAIFMQVIAARLGVVTGKDLAQCCRDWYPRWTRWPNWLLCEVAIGACDLAEVLGSAVALNLMFHIPLLWAVIITGLDVLLALGPAAVRHADHRGRRAAAGGNHLGLLLHRDFRPSANATELFRDGAGPGESEPRPRGHARLGHRHHWGHGHAAQPLLALGPGSDPQAGEGRTVHSPRHPLQHDRLGRGPDHRLLRQRRHHGAGGDRVFRQGERNLVGRRGGDSSATTATGFASLT